MCKMVALNTNYGGTIEVADIKKMNIESIIRAAQYCAYIDAIILFGSAVTDKCSAESDIDIAVLVECDRQDTLKFKDGLVALSAELDLENMVVVNFVCLPYQEFNEKKKYYPFYANIEKEGKVIYG